METKKPSFKIVSALVSFTVMFGIAALATGFAQNNDAAVPEEAIKTCVEKIFEYDREKVFDDVAIQQWYTHMAHLLAIIDESWLSVIGETNTAGPAFYPEKPVTRADFLKMLKSYLVLLENPKKNPIIKLKAKKPNAKIKQKEVVALIAKAFRVPKKDVRSFFKKNRLRGKWVKRGEAAYVIYESVASILPVSPEQKICEIKAAEEPEEFARVFGPAETDDGDGSPSPPAAPATPLPSSPTTPLPSSTTPLPFLSTTLSSLNFAPVNPRAGETVTVKATLLDSENKPAVGEKLTLVLTAGRDYEKTILMNDAGAGAYEADVDSTWAGTYKVGLKTANGFLTATRELTFQPAHPEKLDLVLDTPQEKSASKREAVIAATLRDKFENIVDADARDFRVTTDLGTVKKTEKVGKEIFITVEGDAWGMANVSISHLTRSVQDAAAKIKVPFSPIVFDVPKGIKTGEAVQIPAYVFLPPADGKIAGYKFKLNYDETSLKFQNVTDIDPNDGFDAPKVTKGGGVLQLEQTTRQLPSSQVVPVGNINFLANTVAVSGTVFVPEITVINDQEKTVVFDPPDDFIEDIFRKWYGVKPVKDICLDVWIVEGAASRAEALGDVEKAAEMFKYASALSHCPFWMNFTTNFHSISLADWNAKINAGTTTQQAGDAADLKNNFSGDPNCVQVWYVNDIERGHLGESHPNNGGVTMNDRADYDDRTLGHELAHQLSGNKVLDSPNDNGNAQGAKNPRNPMNYGEPGDWFTKEQCDLINQKPYVK